MAASKCGFFQLHFLRTLKDYSCAVCFLSAGVCVAMVSKWWHLRRIYVAASPAPKFSNRWTWQRSTAFAKLAKSGEVALCEMCCLGMQTCMKFMSDACQFDLRALLAGTYRTVALYSWYGRRRAVGTGKFCLPVSWPLSVVTSRVRTDSTQVLRTSFRRYGVYRQVVLWALWCGGYFWSALFQTGVNFNCTM